MQSDKVILQKTQDGEYIGLSTVDDYKYRPYELNDKSLYEWIQISNRLKCTKAEQKNFLSQNHGNVKPTTVSQSDEEVETDFDSDSDYSESDKVPKRDKIQGKYPFLQNHALYETHQVSISTSNKLIHCLNLGDMEKTLRKKTSLGMKHSQIISSLHANLN